jgi:hypothetical protein
VLCFGGGDGTLLLSRQTSKGANMEWFAEIRNDLSHLSILDSDNKWWNQTDLGSVPIVKWEGSKITVLKEEMLVTFDSIDLQFRNWDDGTTALLERGKA